MTSLLFVWTGIQHDVALMVSFVTYINVFARISHGLPRFHYLVTYLNIEQHCIISFIIHVYSKNYSFNNKVLYNIIINTTNIEEKYDN